MRGRGESVHGEADAVDRLIEPPATVIDGGTGTGRIAVELASRGFGVLGVDYDPDMLARARRRSDSVEWIQADLANLAAGRTVDLVLLAGNVLVFIQPGTGAAVVANMASHLKPNGYLVTGFTTIWDTSPTVEQYRQWVTAAGLEPVSEHATWDGAPYDGGDYLVSITRRRG